MTELQGDDPPDFDAPDDDLPEPPPTFWESVSDVTRGLVALIALSAAVLVLYIAGGVFLGLLTRAAPAVLAISAAIILARYLSRAR
jgi:hypothetical protein